MRKIIASVYTAFVAFAFIAGYVSNTGPLNYVFVIIAGLPWTPLFSRLFGGSFGASPIIAILGVAINLTLIWLWALMRRTKKV